MTKENWLTFFAVVYILLAIIAVLILPKKKKPDEWEWYEE